MFANFSSKISKCHVGLFSHPTYLPSSNVVFPGKSSFTDRIFTVCCCQRALKTCWNLNGYIALCIFKQPDRKFFAYSNQVKDDIVKGYFCLNDIEIYWLNRFLLFLLLTITYLKIFPSKIHFSQYNGQRAYSWIPFTCFEPHSQNISCKTTTEYIKYRKWFWPF